MTPRLDGILQDARFGLRLFRKHASATATVLLSLSLTIGACTAAFALVDALILRPLPVPEPDRLVYVAHRAPDAREDDEFVSYPLFARMRDASRDLVQLFAVTYHMRWEAAFQDAGGRTEWIYPQWVSGDALGLLGVKPALGRLLTAADDVTPGGHPVAVLGYDFWRRRFGGDPAVLGRWLTLRDKPFQIVGVAERGFTSVQPGFAVDVWVPTHMWEARNLTNPSSNWIWVWGRLRPGVSADRARERLQAVSTSFRREHAGEILADARPERVERYANMPLQVRSGATGQSRVRQGFARPLWILGTIAALVLLIACSNVASLLVARTAAREREMALRLAMGARRGRLVRQVLIESALLALASCVLGALVAGLIAPQVVSMLSTTRLAIQLDLQYDRRLFLFLASAGGLVTFLFGLAPAWRASSVAPNVALKQGGGKLASTMRMFRPLAAAQIAFSFVVLFVAGLFLTSFSTLDHLDLGFDRDLTIVNVEVAGLTDPRQSHEVWRRLVDRLRERPGVQAAALSNFALFEGPQDGITLRLPGRATGPVGAHQLGISPGFLETMGIRLLDGRDFAWRDGQMESPSAVIVNESFARRYFPGERALGQRLSAIRGGATNPPVPLEIVGIVEDAKYRSVQEPAPPTVYSPRLHTRYAAVELRTALTPSALAAMVRDDLPGVHPDLRPIGVTRQSTLVDETLVQDRMLALLSGFFSIVAIVLVGVGLYGILSYRVVQRTREIGIRIALGSRPLAVVRLVLAEAGVVTAIGLAAGIPAGVAAAQSIRSLLYGVTPSDLGSLLVPLACLLVAGGLSALAPTVRAVRVDPLTALRHD